MESKEALFERLYGEFRPMVVQLCLGYVKGDAAAAEDIAQEVFVQVWRHLERFRGEASAKTWIYRITVNACLQELRTRSRRPRADATAPLPDGPTLPELSRLVYLLLLEYTRYFTTAVLSLLIVSYAVIMALVWWLGMRPGMRRERGALVELERLVAEADAPTPPPAR